MSPPASPPDPLASLPFVFLDRSLGRIQVPDLLRAAGVQLVTLAEHYGMPADEDVEDVTWLADSAQRGWVAFMRTSASAGAQPSVWLSRPTGPGASASPT